MNLSLTELIIASSGNSILAFNSFQKRRTLSSGACQVNAFGMTYLGIQSIVTLSVLALQRCMMVTRDRQFPLSTINSTLLTLFFIWTYSFLVSFPPILGFGTFSQNTLGVSCGVKWMGTGEDHAMNITYAFYILAIPTMLSKTSVCVNPIIYFWLNPQFRGELSQWWGRGAVTPGSTSTTRTTRMQVNREHGS